MGADAASEKTRRDHARVVQNKQFVAVKQAGQLRERAIFDGFLVALEQKKTGGIAPLERALGNLRLGKVKVEIFEAHPLKFSRIAVKAMEVEDCDLLRVEDLKAEGIGASDFSWPKKCISLKINSLLELRAFRI